MKPGDAFPHAAREAEDAFQEGNAGLDAGPEAAQFVIDPLAPHHGAHGESALLREADIADAEVFTAGEVARRGERAIEGRRGERFGSRGSLCSLRQPLLIACSRTTGAPVRGR